MAVMVYPMAPLCSLNTSNNLSSSLGDSLEDITIGSVSLSPRKAYFNEVGSGFISNLGGDTIEGYSWGANEGEVSIKLSGWM